jgi:hypothetical protein
MKCEHKRLRCTNNVFYCLVCGALVASPVTVEEIIAEKEKPAEGPKKAGKRKAAKVDN